MFQLSAKMQVLVLNIVVISLIPMLEAVSNYSFPDNFLFGTATASYQIEGAWNESGKGPNIWDTLTHEHPELILDGSNGDVACDSYHKYKEDVALLKNLGVDFYRFSISWARIFPSGHPYNLNTDGIDYYNNLIDELLNNDIKPMVTLFHWDLPQGIQDLGGWTNPWIVNYFTEFARVAFEYFGDRVEYWITLNEPYSICEEGYGSVSKAPALGMSGIADYLCIHNLIKSHAAVYHLFDETYRSRRNGTIGITLNGGWCEPNSTSTEDLEASERCLQFSFGWIANPIYTEEGDYPAVMKELIEKKSLQQGFKRSRLPKFTDDEIAYIKGAADFFGINHYTTVMVINADTERLSISHYADQQVTSWQDESWGSSASSWLKVVPCGFRKLLKWIRNTYNNPIIHITENGYSDSPDVGTNDVGRVSYYGQYLEALLDAMYLDNVTVVSYAAWSLLDNFEWMYGYEQRFGIHTVDFDDPDRPRTPKASAEFFKNVIGNRTVVDYTKLFDDPISGCEK